MPLETTIVGVASQSGTAKFSLETAKTVFFNLPYPDSNYKVVSLTANDNVNVWWSNKTPESFTIHIGDGTVNWSGLVDWKVER